MNWLLLTTVSIISSAISNIFQRLAMKDEGSDPIASAILFQFALSFFSFLFALTRGFHLPPANLVFPNLLISTVFYAVGTLLFFKAMKTIGASEKVIMTGFSALVVIVASYIFLGESLSVKQLVGVVTIFAAIGVVELKKEKLSFSTGVKLALGGTTLYGLAVVNDSFILRSYEAVSFVPVMSFLPGMFLTLLYPKSALKMVASIRRTDKNLWLYCIFYVIQAITYYMAIENGGHVSQINSLFKTEIILTVLLATILLKERDRLIKKCIGALLASIGVLLIK